MATSKHIKGIPSDNLKRPVKVYDVDAKQLIGAFESVHAAGKFTGVAKASIYHFVKTKNRCTKNKLNKTLAFR